jgi:hypothetical protein
MSDYLNNIVVRTLGLAPVVQPRLSSLFEPLPLAPGDGSIPSFEGETTGRYESLRNSTSEVPGRTLVPHAADMQPPMTREPKYRGIDRAVSKADEADTQEQPVDTVIRHSTINPSAPLINPRMGLSSLLSKSDSEGLRFQSLTHEPQEPHEPQVNPPAFAEREANGLENSPHRAPRLPETAAGLPDQTRAPSPNAHDRAQPVMARTTQKSSAAIAVTQPNRLPVSQARKAFAQPTLASEVPPTISVTIGRVDVRAIFAQPQAPRVSRDRQPAATSLDEYLKQRNEGRR